MEENKVTLKINKKTLGIIVVLVIVIGLLYSCRGLFVAAMVNGSPLTRLEVIEELEKASGKQALNALIAKKLVYADAKKNNVTVTGEEVDTEIAKIGIQLQMQGQTLDQALLSQGISLDTFKEQIYNQKLLEKLVSGGITVSDEEIAQFVKDNKLTVPKGQEQEFNAQVKEQLMQQKLAAAQRDYIEKLRSDAKITIVVNY